MGFITYFVGYFKELFCIVPFYISRANLLGDPNKKFHKSPVSGRPEQEISQKPSKWAAQAENPAKAQQVGRASKKSRRSPASGPRKQKIPQKPTPQIKPPIPTILSAANLPANLEILSVKSHILS